jgi:hypothetical protein
MSLSKIPNLEILNDRNTQELTTHLLKFINKQDMTLTVDPVDSVINNAMNKNLIDVTEQKINTYRGNVNKLQSIVPKINKIEEEFMKLLDVFPNIITSIANKVKPVNGEMANTINDFSNTFNSFEQLINNIDVTRQTGGKGSVDFSEGVDLNGCVVLNANEEELIDTNDFFIIFDYKINESSNGDLYSLLREYKIMSHKDCEKPIQRIENKSQYLYVNALNDIVEPKTQKYKNDIVTHILEKGITGNISIVNNAGEIRPKKENDDIGLRIIKGIPGIIKLDIDSPKSIKLESEVIDTDTLYKMVYEINKEKKITDVLCNNYELLLKKGSRIQAILQAEREKQEAKSKRLRERAMWRSDAKTKLEKEKEAAMKIIKANEEEKRELNALRGGGDNILETDIEEIKKKFETLYYHEKIELFKIYLYYLLNIKTDWHCKNKPFNKYDFKVIESEKDASEYVNVLIELLKYPLVSEPEPDCPLGLCGGGVSLWKSYNGIDFERLKQIYKKIYIYNPETKFVSIKTTEFIPGFKGVHATGQDIKFDNTFYYDSTIDTLKSNIDHNISLFEQKETEVFIKCLENIVIDIDEKKIAIEKLNEKFNFNKQIQEAANQRKTFEVLNPTFADKNNYLVRILIIGLVGVILFCLSIGSLFGGGAGWLAWFAGISDFFIKALIFIGLAFLILVYGEAIEQIREPLTKFVRDWLGFELLPSSPSFYQLLFEISAIMREYNDSFNEVIKKIIKSETYLAIKGKDNILAKGNDTYSPIFKTLSEKLSELQSETLDVFFLCLNTDPVNGYTESLDKIKRFYKDKFVGEAEDRNLIREEIIGNYPEEENEILTEFFTKIDTINAKFKTLLGSHATTATERAKKQQEWNELTFTNFGSKIYDNIRSRFTRKTKTPEKIEKEPKKASSGGGLRRTMRIGNPLRLRRQTLKPIRIVEKGRKLNKSHRSFKSQRISEEKRQFIFNSFLNSFIKIFDIAISPEKYILSSHSYGKESNIRIMFRQIFYVIKNTKILM